MSFIEAMQVTRNDDATVTITGEIPYEELLAHKEVALTHLGKDLKLDGFRPGHIPTQVLEEKLGEMTVLTEMAERALAKAYPLILKTHQIDALGYPSVSITKLAPGNPLGFSATVATLPPVTLPDYKALAASCKREEQATVVTDSDIDEAIKNILRQKAAYERLQQKAAAKEPTSSTDLPTPETVAHDETEAPLPELTDELAATLGPFASVTELKDKVREELATQKTNEATTKHRAALSDAIIEATELTIPDVLIEAEHQQMLAQMNEDLKRAQLSMDEYLAHIKKSEDDLKNEWRPAAEKRAKIQIVLDAIAEAEKITPDETLVQEQVKALKTQYPDADEARVQTYVETILKNEAVMKLLEAQSA